jgi:hypothetical protein
MRQKLWLLFGAEAMQDPAEENDEWFFREDAGPSPTDFGIERTG